MIDRLEVCTYRSIERGTEVRALHDDASDSIDDINCWDTGDNYNYFHR